MWQYKDKIQQFLGSIVAEDDNESGGGGCDAQTTIHSESEGCDRPRGPMDESDRENAAHKSSERPSATNSEPARPIDPEAAETRPDRVESVSTIVQLHSTVHEAPTVHINEPPRLFTPRQTKSHTLSATPSQHL
nr:hypothetical protein Iba_chr12dCG4650 [Ipomoea batatas]